MAVKRIAVRQGSRFRLARAADPDLADGFYPFEAGIRLRWTNGDAALPDAIFAWFCGRCEAVVHLSATTRYIDDGNLALKR